MITLYGFGNVHPGMIGKGRDLRAQWALTQTFFSPCYGMLVDRFGVHWMVMARQDN